MRSPFLEVNGFTLKDKRDRISIVLHADEMIDFLTQAEKLPNGTVQLIASKLAIKSPQGFTHSRPVVANDEWQPVLKTA